MITRTIETAVGWYPSVQPLATPHAGGLLVAGGAARLVGAESGEGIWQAAFSGREAARSVVRGAGGALGVDGPAYRTRLNRVYDELEKVSKQVLSGEVTDTLAGEALEEIARQEDLNGRIRRNMMDTRRAVSFMMRSRMLNADQFDDARQILRDIESLDNHTAFLFDKINFLMDATVGFININQNKIIKIFSVASVALLPPTLIASLYGMNFQYMPELSQKWGYPFALALMVASALVPMWYFRKRGWLR